MRRTVPLEPGLNVFVGRNAQGKTSLLEAVALLARGRSFRTERVQQLIRRGAPFARAAGVASAAPRRPVALQVDVRPEGATLHVDGGAGHAGGVPGPAGSGRLFDRPVAHRPRAHEGAAHLPRTAAPRRCGRPTGARCASTSRWCAQRNACLERGGRDLEAWDERLIELGAALRHRRAGYAARLRAALREGYRPQGETYDVAARGRVAAPGARRNSRRRCAREVELRRRDEQRARRSLAGPHRDAVRLNIEGSTRPSMRPPARRAACCWRSPWRRSPCTARSAAISAVALLDDLDSELDEARAAQLCREVAAQGQALVTTAHPGWARRLGLGRVFTVDEGRVTAA